MTASIFSPSLAAPIPGALKKKRVLLVDASTVKRDLRADALRNLGIEVDCAADIAEARSWWRADLYNLVLVNVAKGLGHRDKFCDDVRNATPPQQLAFLVGQPEYLAASPNADEKVEGQQGNIEATGGNGRAALSPERDDSPLRWGILAASRRISSVRAAAIARTRALRAQPEPPRDLEPRYAERPARSRTLDDLMREEMQ